MIRTAFLLGVLLASTPSYAQAPFPFPFDMRGTPEDRKACERDAIKLCRNELQDDMAVLRCFQRQPARLTPTCRAVLQKYGQLSR